MNVKKIFITFIAIDICIIVSHLVFGIDLFDLDLEANVPAWYSSAKLFCLFGLCLMSLQTEKEAVSRGIIFKRSWLWILVAGIFLFLSIDETASIHERVAGAIMKESSIGLDIRESVLGGDTLKDSFAWVLLLSPFIIGVTLFFIIFFVQRFKLCKKAMYVAMGGLACYLLAIGLESSIYAFPSFASFTEENMALYKSLLVVEESGEIFGSTLFVFCFLTYLNYVREKSAPQIA